jgi:hypothetical protein
MGADHAVNAETIHADYDEARAGVGFERLRMTSGDPTKR